MGKMLTVTEAAEHFKVSTATIRRWIRSGRVRSQLTLGPFGEQWMIDSDQNSPKNERSDQGYIAVDQLTQAPQEDDQNLLKEAEQALEQAWQAKLQAEQELADFKAQVPSSPDVLSLRCDLEGSERQRLRLETELRLLQQERDMAWQETRTALAALKKSYQDFEELGKRCRAIETESDCLRRALGQRVGLDWQEFSLAQLFLRWEALQEPALGTPSPWVTSSHETPSWSNYRRSQVSSENTTLSG